MASQLKTLAEVNLTAAGTAQQITATVTEVEAVVINAGNSNSGVIFVGDSNVSSTRYAARLAAGERVSIDAGGVGGGNSDFLDMSEIYIDGDTTNDDVYIGYIQKAN